MWLLAFAIIGNIVPGGLFPLGRVRWYWFVAMTLLGTLAFRIPLFLWLNWRLQGEDRVPFREWWNGS